MAATCEGPGYGTGASVFERDAIEPLSRLASSPEHQRLTLTVALDSVPAEVVMRSGMLPSQQRALRRVFKKADAFDSFRTRTRRAFFGLGSLAAALGLGGVLIGRASVTEANPSPADGYRSLAHAPLEQLRGAHLGFLAALEQAPQDTTLWVGFERLAQAALSNPTDTDLLRRLRASMRALKPAAGFEWLRDRLAE